MQSIDIDARGDVYFNEKPATLETLKSSLQQIPKETPLLIRADRSIRLQAFVDVLDVVKTLEFTRVSLQTEEKR